MNLVKPPIAGFAIQIDHLTNEPVCDLIKSRSLVRPSEIGIGRCDMKLHARYSVRQVDS